MQFTLRTTQTCGAICNAKDDHPLRAQRQRERYEDLDAALGRLPASLLTALPDPSSHTLTPFSSTGTTTRQGATPYRVSPRLLCLLQARGQAFNPAGTLRNLLHHGVPHLQRG